MMKNSYIQLNLFVIKHPIIFLILFSFLYRILLVGSGVFCDSTQPVSEEGLSQQNNKYTYINNPKTIALTLGAVLIFALVLGTFTENPEIIPGLFAVILNFFSNESTPTETSATLPAVDSTDPILTSLSTLQNLGIKYHKMQINPQFTERDLLSFQSLDSKITEDAITENIVVSNVDLNFINDSLVGFIYPNGDIIVMLTSFAVSNVDAQEAFDLDDLDESLCLRFKKEGVKGYYNPYRNQYYNLT